MLPLNHSINSQEQWLVSSLENNPLLAGQVIMEVIQLFRLIPGVEVMGVLGLNTPTQAIIRANSNIITLIQAALANRIVITQDQPLQLF